MHRILEIAFGALLLPLAPTTAAADPIHIVAFGDSMTAGYLVPHEDAYPAQLEAALRGKGYDVTVKNAGRNGDSAKQALKRFDMAVDPGTDLAIVEFGINDRRAGASLAQVRTRIVEIVHALRARGIQVLVVGTGGLDFSELAAANGAAYVAWKLPPHRYRARDGAHFNADGYRILVERMLPQVEALLGHARGTAN
jgi:acyl-CoA thioesterase-1